MTVTRVPVWHWVTILGIPTHSERPKESFKLSNTNSTSWNRFKTLKIGPCNRATSWLWFRNCHIEHHACHPPHRLQKTSKNGRSWPATEKRSGCKWKSMENWVNQQETMECYWNSDLTNSFFSMELSGNWILLPPEIRNKSGLNQAVAWSLDGNLGREWLVKIPNGCMTNLEVQFQS